MQKCDVNPFDRQGALGEGASQAGGEEEEERGGRQQERPRLLRVLPQGGEGEVGQTQINGFNGCADSTH